MELKDELSFDQLLDAVKHLTEGQREIIRQELDKKPEKHIDVTEFQKMLLNGPVMSDEHYKIWKQTRKEINQWRTK